MKKQIVALLLAMCLAVCLLPGLSLTAAAAESGTCGENLTWTLEDGTLTISGTGAMDSWNFSTYVPWERNSSSITTVVLGDGITSIGGYAFYGCSSLTSVTIPDSVTSIGGSAFGYCSSLTSVAIPGSVTGIGVSAFANCRSLTSITIPDSVTSITVSAFPNCNSLASITVAEGNANYSSADGVFFNKEKTELIKHPAKKPETEYIIPNSVTSIGESAFSRCSSLTSVSIPDGVTSIGGYALSGCSGLTSISIPNSVTSIGSSVFSGCSGLTSIFIPNSVTSIPSDALSGCYSLTSITVAEGNLNYRSQDGVLFDRSMTSLIQYPAKKADTNYTIPAGVSSVSNQAFYNADNLTAVEIPNSVSSIGDRAFGWCDNLSQVKLSASVTYIGSWAFSVNKNLLSIEVDEENPYYCSVDGVLFNEARTMLIQYPVGSSAASYSIPETVTHLESYSFAYADELTDLVMPTSVTSVGTCAFLGCDSLSDVNYPGTVQQWIAVAIDGANDPLLDAAFPEIPDVGVDSTDSNYTNSTLAVDLTFDYVIKDSLVHLAVYDTDNTLIGIRKATVTRGSGSTALTMIDGDLQEGYTYKIMLWDASNLSPHLTPLDGAVQSRQETAS